MRPCSFLHGPYFSDPTLPITNLRFEMSLDALKKTTSILMQSAIFMSQTVVFKNYIAAFLEYFVVMINCPSNMGTLPLEFNDCNLGTHHNLSLKLISIRSAE